jgi:hypothetical protein
LDAELMIPMTSSRTGLLDALWRHKWLVALCICVGTAGGWYIGDREEKTYVATTEVVLAVSEESVFGSSSSLGNQDRILLDELARFSSPEVTQRTADLAGLTARQVVDRVDVRAAADHNAFTIKAEGPTGEAAASLAADVVEAYGAEIAAARATRDDQYTAALQGYRDELAAELDALDQQVAERRQLIHDFVATQVVDPLALEGEVDRAWSLDDELATLTARRADVRGQLIDTDARLRQREIDASLRGNGISLVLPAGVPDDPEGQAATRYAVLGAALGALLAGVIAVTRTERRALARSTRDVATALGVRPLGVLPVGATRSLARPDPALATAGHVVAGAVLAAVDRSHGDTVVVAAPSDPELGGSVALLMSHTMARRGERVLLVEAGSRIARRKRSRPDPATGFADLVAGTASLDDVLTEPADLDGVSVVRRGRELQPGAIDRSSLRTELLRWRERFDVVVFTGGPVLGSPIGVDLAALAGCLVLVVPARTPIAQLLQVRELLDARDIELGGFIYVNRTLRRRRRAAGSTLNVDAPSPHREVPMVEVPALQPGKR